MTRDEIRDHVDTVDLALYSDDGPSIVEAQAALSEIAARIKELEQRAAPRCGDCALWGNVKDTGRTYRQCTAIQHGVKDHKTESVMPQVYTYEPFGLSDGTTEWSHGSNGGSDTACHVATAAVDDEATLPVDARSAVVSDPLTVALLSAVNSEFCVAPTT